MSRSEGFLTDCQRFAVHSPGFAVAFLYLIQTGQIIEALGHAWVQRTQGILSNSECPLKNTFGFGIAGLFV